MTSAHLYPVIALPASHDYTCNAIQDRHIYVVPMLHTVNCSDYGVERFDVLNITLKRHPICEIALESFRSIRSSCFLITTHM